MKDTTYHALKWLLAACVLITPVTADVTDNSGQGQLPSTCGGMQLLDNRVEERGKPLEQQAATSKKMFTSLTFGCTSMPNKREKIRSVRDTGGLRRHDKCSGYKSPQDKADRARQTSRYN
ncbi:hypothetical protein, unlikely [Trypanosoma brucei gambiense DAL972]|uniref:T. brucei spp.-specific protein n=1 Tax=Trypanosoma brucei gambiense (strain MHOM/CI/86/DAL972) TaxID=679716 RepID=C9ZQ12_TRYB9|nr:hypothetical protein, unlikely [Trypanosoma brucei gambiense DAL972]CBH11490.1 hypothetical protein, unlikely [Trypanosoma brucei gambiense DAL972]|eukprot:XP_011773777.1 hypothetical protein, unlikely [Trypanosoma brucei gambiense DAL972]